MFGSLKKRVKKSEVETTTVNVQMDENQKILQNLKKRKRVLQNELKNVFAEAGIAAVERMERDFSSARSMVADLKSRIEAVDAEIEEIKEKIEKEKK